jgi:small subunit ribosomal protein S17
MTEVAERGARKERMGVVVSDAQDKTIVVRVDRRHKHAKYHKTVNASKKYHVHDETNDANVGDTVRVVETRPISKNKRWRLLEVVERAK